MAVAGKPTNPGALTSTENPFSFAFKLWFSFLFFILLPLDIIYRIESLIVYSTWSMIGIDASFLIVILAGLVFLLAGFSALLSGVIWLVFPNRSARLVNWLNVIIALGIIIIVICRYAWFWARKVFNIVVVTGEIKIVVVLFGLPCAIFLLYLFLRPSFWENIRAFSNKAFRIGFPLLLLAIVVCIAFISYRSLSVKEFAGQNMAVGLPAPERVALPNIILVTFDALAAGNMSLYGYPRKTTPNLEAFAKESYVFDHMIASSNCTIHSLRSLMHGKKLTTLEAELRDFSKNMRARSYQNLPVVMRSLGYETVSITTNTNASPWMLLLDDFDRFELIAGYSKWYVAYCMAMNNIGFNVQIWVDDIINIINIVRPFFPLAGNSPMIASQEETINAALTYMRQAKKPFFLWVHIIQPHFPYLASSDFLYRYLQEKVFDNITEQLKYHDMLSQSLLFYPPDQQPNVDKLALRYNEYILYTDHVFGGFIQKLREDGFLAGSILIVSSDHGEIFERGYFEHSGPYLYQPLVHVPMIVHLPGQRVGKRLGANASHIDIPPTILDFLGCNPPDWMEGESLKKFMEGTTSSPQLKYAINLTISKDRRYPWDWSFAVFRDRYKLIYYRDSGRSELYDVRADPREENNLVNLEPVIFHSLKSDLDRIAITGR